MSRLFVPGTKPEPNSASSAGTPVETAFPEKGR